MRFVEKQPRNDVADRLAREYGFYANVNPTVDHPRWSQATERRLGEFLRRKTRAVQRLRRAGGASVPGMDLRKNY